MTLRLSIENVDRLPDGGPVRIEVRRRGLDLGRDAHLDWTLPDPSRTISSKHCEIRYRDGGYWLRDISTNGTFVNGAEFRLDAPHLLHDGDRLNIGPYIIAVSVEGEQTVSNTASAPAISAAGALPDVWSAVGEAAAPESREGYKARKTSELPPDFLDHAAAVEPVGIAAGAPAVDDWLAAPAPGRPFPPPPPPLAQALPSPRRPPGPIADGRGPPAVASVSPSARPPAREAEQTSELLTRIARAAGIPERVFAGRDPDAIADEIGAAIRLTAVNLAQMLSSRADSKTLMRSSSRTMIRAIENNPLKFAGSGEEALGIMFGPPTRQYLGAQATIEQSFTDLKTHQILTYGAMQSALDALFEDLAPGNIDRSAEPDKGLSGLILSRKAKLWDIYVERWRAKTKRADGRLLDAFMALFAEAYDRLQKRGA
ncbi:MAG: type VI secretion system-associated FHA domain protein TagH [Hyphomicrobiales bacterium]|nr:type VI secretion system-associated FHA domain protein TagH [Hyphomicrobiales bacterium]